LVAAKRSAAALSGLEPRALAWSVPTVSEAAEDVAGGNGGQSLAERIV